MTKEHYIKKMQKSKTRIFVNKTISSNLIIHIKDKQHHFLKNVLRVQINDSINIFDGTTGEWKTKVLSVNKDKTILLVINNIRKMIHSPDIFLFFVPIKKYRMNITIQKATELGVSKIIPCITEYTNVRTINLKSLQDNAIEAAEQSDRLDVPKVDKLLTLKNLLSEWPEDRNLIFCDEKTHHRKEIIETLFSLKNNKKKWAVLIGPEGGFSDPERELITNNTSVISVSLGKRLLRSDTAITVTLFCIQAFLDR